MKDVVVAAFLAMMGIGLALSLAAAISTAFTGCSHGIEEGDGQQVEDGRFTSPSHSLKWDVVTDTETGVSYLFVSYGLGSGGLTVLVDADGKPIVKEDA